MEVRVITGSRAEVVPLAGLTAALADPATLVWVDIPACDEESVVVLREVLRLHPVAIRECQERQRMPKFHPYPDPAGGDPLRCRPSRCVTGLPP